MNLFDGIWSYCSAAGVFIFGLALAVYFSIKYYIDVNKGIIIYLWHTLYSIMYLLFVVDRHEDAIMYYSTSLQGIDDISLGTSFIVAFTRIFSHYFDMSVFGVFMIYNIIGYIGLMLFFILINSLLIGAKKYSFLSLIVFLPSINFWTGAIGKDSISFLSTVLILWACLSNYRAYYMGIAILLMALVRPHISAIIFISYFIYYLVNPENKIANKIVTIIMGLIIIAPMASFLINYSGYGNDPGDDDMDSYIENKQSANMVGGGSVDTSSMILPVKFFSYLFRPMLFDVRAAVDFFPALDNLIQFCLVFAGILSWIYYGKKYKISNFATFLWTYVFMNVFMLSTLMSNYGISLRQKWMVMPIIIYLSISAIVRKA